MRFYGARARGQTVVKKDGAYTTYDLPEQATLDAADLIRWPSGELKPAVYLGGHEYEVTAAEATDLTNAGYTVT